MYAPLTSGTLLDNRYRIVGMAKRGSLGQTYLVRDQKQLNALCVLKEFIPNQQDPAVIETLLQLFHQEASALYELRHPQLPRPRAMLVQDQRIYWIREYVEGKSYNVILDSRKARGQFFSEADVLDLMMKVLPVLSYLHSKGVVHGNLTLDTLILRQQDQLPVLINYGLVRDLVVRLQLHPVEPEEALGTPGYVPPEKITDGQVYPCSDIYSLGVVAISLLTGRAPVELYNPKTKTFEWESLVNISPRFARILKQMVEARPQKRFASAAQVIQALEPLMDAAAQPPVLQPPAPPSVPEPVLASAVPPQPEADTPPIPAPDHPKPRSPRQPGDARAATALVVGIVLLLGVIAWRTLPFFRGDRQSPESQPSEVSGKPVDQPTPSPAQAESGQPDAGSPIVPAKPAPADSGSNLRDRVQKLGISPQYFNNLADETFYARYPKLKGQPGGSAALQGTQKEDWNEIASALADRLESIRPESRKKLGSYQMSDYNRWLKELGESNRKNSPTLDALTDGRFYKLFPEWKGRKLTPNTMGQVWFAIADEMVEPAKARKAGKKR